MAEREEGVAALGLADTAAAAAAVAATAVVAVGNTVRGPCQSRHSLKIGGLSLLEEWPCTAARCRRSRKSRNVFCWNPHVLCIRKWGAVAYAGYAAAMRCESSSCRRIGCQSEMWLVRSIDKRLARGLADTVVAG